MKIISHSVERSSLGPCVNPIDGLPGVYFHTKLMSVTKKNSDAPDYLRQSALEVIDGIPSDSFDLYRWQLRRFEQRGKWCLYQKSFSPAF
ncbi:hypothetical protein TNCT_673171 [Trichonephila clavata]|uniref:Uncharacterized protein n=1 Tax=Trichonephila clavata TaxID=2740835 RepID=A0A8X6HPZ0_TRICU|nr:hypothetical protein TNCT_673171 [Trichonephila clavata]